jgi:hypothetical protein
MKQAAAAGAGGSRKTLTIYHFPFVISHFSL